MSDPTTFFAIAIIATIVAGVALLLLWRMRVHLAKRADAEARMAAAMQELQILSARLQAVKAAAQARGADSESPTST